MSKKTDEVRSVLEGIRDERRTAANTATRVGNAIIMLLDYLTGDDAPFLSKEHDDTAQGFIRFVKGLQVGNMFTSGILGEGGVFRKDDDGKIYIEADKLYVRMKAYFDSVEIRDYQHTSGNRIASQAKGFTASRVEWLDADGKVLEQKSENLPSVVKFRCYWRAKDDEHEAENQFVIGDQAFMEYSDIVDGSLIQKRFWRVVTGRNVSVTEDGEAWIDLSNKENDTITYIDHKGTSRTKSVTGYESNSSIPQPEDDICQLGNVWDSERQGAIIEYVSGGDAPSYQIFQGIDSFSLDGRNYIGLGYSSLTGNAYINVYGDAYIGDKAGEGGYMRFNQQQRLLEIKGRLNVGSTLSDGRDVNALGVNRGNLLLNTSFTGDYDSEEVNSDTSVDSDTVMYSDPLRHWTANNVTIVPFPQSSSKYAATIATGGSLAQSVTLEKGKWYVLSFRGVGGSLGYTIGGVSGTLQLKETLDTYDVPFVCGDSESGLKLTASSEVTLMELRLNEGNLPMSWSQNYNDGNRVMAAVNAYKYISDAIRNASTDIIGGLILSQIIKVGNYRDKVMTEETGGMSGAWLDDNSPFLWGGGKMSQAIYTIAKYANDPSYEPTQEEIEAMAKFVVTHGGRAILNDVILRGYIYALGGYFRGKITAKSGDIGGFDIGEESLSNKNYDAGIAIQDAAVNPTQVSRIGKDAVDEMTGKPCSLQAESTQPGMFNTALFLKAEGATYNYAFHGNGNGVLNGLMFGYKTKSITVSTSSQSLGSMILQDGSTILVTGNHGGNHTTNPPLLSVVRNCLGIRGSDIPFSIEVEIINLTSGNLQIFFRNYTGYTSDEYPYLMSNNGNVESGGSAIITITPGGYLKLRLVYVNDSKAYRAHSLVYNHE